MEGFLFGLLYNMYSGIIEQFQENAEHDRQVDEARKQVEQQLQQKSKIRDA